MRTTYILCVGPILCTNRPYVYFILRRGFRPNLEKGWIF